YIGNEISGIVPGGVSGVIDHASAAGKFEFWPDMNSAAILGFIAAWVTMMFGSIPQQDVFQRMQSAKTIKIAVWASVLGGVLYFIFTFVPMFLAYSATLIDPNMVAAKMEEDSQLILPTLILEHAPLFAQIVFFGALLSAIKSCASATLLAPSVMFTENILRPMLPRLDDKRLLKLMRTVTASFTVMVTFYAMFSDSSIFEMVENAYQVTLVAAFIPLLSGIFWSKATKQGALLSIVAGSAVWVWLMAFGETAWPEMPAQLGGLFASAIGMVVGSLAPQIIDHNPDVHHALRAGEYGYDQGGEGGSTSG
ncbi:MAG TPA: sodium:solute symporter, partial [Alphaproteobacteria bacterium]